MAGIKIGTADARLGKQPVFIDEARLIFPVYIDSCLIRSKYSTYLQFGFRSHKEYRDNCTQTYSYTCVCLCLSTCLRARPLARSSARPPAGPLVSTPCFRNGIPPGRAPLRALSRHVSARVRPRPSYIVL